MVVEWGGENVVEGAKLDKRQAMSDLEMQWEVDLCAKIEKCFDELELAKVLF